ncbi:MAG TPA: GNAT family N-acetyltransferase [Solirubrobacteraceae bacterium]|nr:GNAT family N-acetyltransferase [Solirubrobacteraceae bacterium]
MSSATPNTPHPPRSLQAPQLRWARDWAEIEQAFRLRERVFCDEQGVPLSQERDALDDRAMHMVAVGAGGGVVGTLRLVLCNEVARVGRIAVDAGWRRRGIASAMLDAALRAALERGCSEARLAAQVRAVGLYEQAGFRAVSEHFQEAGIAHVWMRRALA